MADGLAHVARTPFLRAVVLITAPASAALTALTSTTTIAMRQAGASSALIGTAMSALGVGAVVGALAAPPLVQRLRLRPLLIATTAALLVGAALTSALTGTLFMTVPLAAAHLLTPGIDTALLSRFAATTPHHLQGRVLSVVHLASGGLGALAPVTAGWVMSGRGATSAAVVAAAVLVVPLVTALSTRSLSEAHPAAP